MKNKIIIAIIMICLVSGIGITGAFISIRRPTTILDLPQDKQDALNLRLNIPNDITQYIGETVCDDTVCKTSFIIKDSIDTVIKVPKKYCFESEINITIYDGVITQNETVCKTELPYTPPEIHSHTIKVIRNRLFVIADAEATRKMNIETEKDTIIDAGIKKAIK